MFFVCEGAVELYQENSTGERFVLEECGEGSFFGEVSLFGTGRRAASGLVVRDLLALELEKLHVLEFLETCPEASFSISSEMAARLSTSSDRLRQTVTRNPVQVIEESSNLFEHFADYMAAFSGSVAFLIVHTVVYGGWIAVNLLLGKHAFDKFPFLLLDIIAAMEAIFLSCFVLMSQSRQAAKDRLRSEIEYEVNVASERQINQLHKKIDDLAAELRVRPK
jgi:CRP/FNR family cyclic AMP-dependent transcriptional regulator